jgi:DNA-binding NtrC family response regulator
LTQDICKLRSFPDGMYWRSLYYSAKRLGGKKSSSDSGVRAINSQNNRNMVVLIEPDISVRDALTILLEGEGWQVHNLEQCEELEAVIRQDSVVAVISESSLAKCTPQEILERCSRAGLPVIFTGHDLPLQCAVDLIRQGATDFLDKPFPQSRLLDLLDRLQNQTS